VGFIKRGGGTAGTMASCGLPRLAFSPLSPAPDVGFWQELTRRKLDVLRLDSRAVPVHAYYEAPAAQGAPEKCFLLRESFECNPRFQAGGTLLRGDLKNFNTVEEFKAFLGSGARAARIQEAARVLREEIVSGVALDDPVRLRPILIVSFADLKRWHFAYTVAFPVLSPSVSWELQAASQGAEAAGIGRNVLRRLSQELRDDSALSAAGTFLLVRGSVEEPWSTRPLAALKGCEDVLDDNLLVVFIDPSSAEQTPGWPLRNLILLIARHRPSRLRILAFRDPHLCARGDEVPSRSRVFIVDASAEAAAVVLGEPEPPMDVQFAGWSKIRNFDLTSFLDAKRVAADAVDLNIKLMKWRLLPELEPGKMKELRFLLLGAGTLGCSVARVLMGWGVRCVTFVDSGKVSFSNPVRQSLFTHNDASESRSKAKAAREAVEAIMPDAEAQDVEMEVPMPGHPHQSPETLRKAIRRLAELVAAHDVVCMLTDSRESRWLPSLLVCAAQVAAPAKLELGRTAVGTEPVAGGASSGLEFSPAERTHLPQKADTTQRPQKADTTQRPPPLGLTVALGFDSFLVSRQTYRESSSACYFCNDVTAPADSLASRTLDQQCTVTRPGLSGLAASVAVELVAALVQHPDGFRAKSDVSSPLGAVPHQVRGYIADFRLAPTETEPFPRCICCSPAVIDCFMHEGDAFVERIVANSAELEEISGLAKMKAGVSDHDVMNFDDFDEGELEE